MILSYAYDIEVLPNFFSVTIISINDYLKQFKDACKINKKGKKNLFLLHKFILLKKLLINLMKLRNGNSILQILMIVNY